MLAEAVDHLRAARLSRECRAAGLAVATPDALIASLTLGRNARLFTLDRDFERIAAVVPLALFAG